MQNLISVIVPMYNGEKYILRCLNSLIGQTYKKFEILLIDDGSIDSTQEICDIFIKKHKNTLPDIKYFYKKNGGTSSARNFGINKANGDYITFIDQDDYVSQNHIKYFADYLDNNFDWIMQGLINIKENGEVLKTYRTNQLFEFTDKRQFDRNFDKIAAFDWVNNKLYKKNIVLAHNVQFFSTHPIINEDRVFNICYSLHIKKISMLPVCSYFWVENFNSQTHRYIHPVVFYREACIYDKFIKKDLIGYNLSKYSCKHAIRCFTHCIGLCIISKKNRLNYTERLNLIKMSLLKLFSSNSIKIFPLYSLSQLFINVFKYIIKFIRLRKTKNFDLI